MDEMVVLNALFVITFFVSLLLLFVALAAVGKQISDIEYQKVMKLNGIRHLQSNINMRKHSGRVLLGFVFLSVSISGFMSLPIIIRMWLNRTEFFILIIFFAASAIYDWLAEYKQLKLVMNTNPSEGLSILRLQVHSIRQEVSVLYGFNELVLKSNLDTNSIDYKSYVEALEGLNHKLETLQHMIREKDPAYKLEKQQAAAGGIV